MWVLREACGQICREMDGFEDLGKDDFVVGHDFPCCISPLQNTLPVRHREIATAATFRERRRNLV